MAEALPHRVEAIRRFNRFYTQKIGVLEEGLLRSPFTLGQVRVAFPTAPSVMISAQQLTSAGATYGQFLGWNGTHWVPMYPTLINFTPNTIGLGVSANAAADLAVLGSPAVLGGSLFLNVPDAGATSRGVVTIHAQTFAGQKTFQDGIVVNGPSIIAGYVPISRQVTTGHGLSGGGPLTADLPLAVVDNSTIQKIQVLENTTPEGTRSSLNLIQGPNVTLTVADNPGKDWVDITIAGVGQTVPPGVTAGDIMVWAATPAPGFWTILPRGAAGSVLTAGTTSISWGSVTGYVPASRQIITGDPNISGLTGGGNLTADLTLAVVPNTTVQKIVTYSNTTQRGVRRALNFVAGQYIQLTIADNPGSDWVDITITSNVPGQAGPSLPAGAETGDTLVWQNAIPGFWTTLPPGAEGTVLTITSGVVSWT